MRFAIARRIGAELAVEFGELGADAGTEIGEGAAGVDQRQEQGLSAVLMEGDVFAVLVDEMEVGYFVAGRGYVSAGGGLGWLGRVGVYFYVFEPILAGLGDHDVGGDGVAGSEVVDLGRRLEGVGHDHLVHKIGDGLVVDVGGAGVFVDGDYFAG